MTRLQTTLAKLPEKCFAVLRSTGGLIMIKREESGYYPMRLGENGGHVFDEEAERMANELNADLGVTPAQRSAMEHGSMFGWDAPAADPDHEINKAVAGNECPS